MRIHLIGVCGTGMGSLAGLLQAAGHHVTGSDTAFYPPMGEALVRWGITCLTGFDPAHLEPRPDLVVVGNVCRSNNPEARAAIDGAIRYLSMPAALEALFLAGRRSYVVAGTHGKTTTSAALAYLLEQSGLTPGFLIGGIPNDFPESFRGAPAGGVFVVEGDEYDSAFFEKKPKFLRYCPFVASINAIEHDHIDIYPDLASYLRAFSDLVALIPKEGLLVGYAADPLVRQVAPAAASRVVYFSLRGEDTAGLKARWQARRLAPTPESELQPFELWVDGTNRGVFSTRLTGSHNLRNVLTALAMAHDGAGVSLETLARVLPGFSGVRRRQQLRGVAAGVSVYDDFAHHPTAVSETLKALRTRHPRARLIAIFEPRSATASRRTHQDAYPSAFREADITFLAPVGRPEIPDHQKLDVGAIANEIVRAGGQAECPATIEAIIERVTSLARPTDVVIAMSNGAFGNIHQRLLEALAARQASA
jgi:UDP-N-acetylmuramate: L-alanyl-gamma-D-glutamyl-meso-diaminopimelate ligase